MLGSWGIDRIERQRNGAAKERKGAVCTMKGTVGREDSRLWGGRGKDGKGG